MRMAVEAVHGRGSALGDPWAGMSSNVAVEHSGWKLWVDRHFHHYYGLRDQQIMDTYGSQASHL